MDKWKQRLPKASAMKDEHLAVDHPTWDLNWNETGGARRSGIQCAATPSLQRAVAASRVSKLDVISDEENTGKFLESLGIGVCMLAGITVVAWWSYVAAIAIVLFSVAATLVIGRMLRANS